MTAALQEHAIVLHIYVYNICAPPKAAYDLINLHTPLPVYICYSIILLLNYNYLYMDTSIAVPTVVTDEMIANNS